MADIDNDSVHDVEIGIVGSGSMGSGMTLLFSSYGSRIGFYDYEEDAVKALLEKARKDDKAKEDLVHGFTTLDKLVAAFPASTDDGQKKQPRILVLSLPHGPPVDGILDDLLPLLDKGDIIIDGGNEWWAETERRQSKAKEKGIEWVGMGVSGGYQSARWGPSMSPGGSKESWEYLKPYLEKWSAKTGDGEPCVAYIGPGGSGHYVKMIHNGIEHAHLSILCEVRALLHFQLGFSDDDIADIFQSWYESGPLRGNFLIGIGFKGLRFKKGDHIQDDRGIVEKYEDKITQDVDKSEGTGTWSTKEIAERHVAAPAIAAAHQLRVISADKFERLKVVDNLQVPQPSEAKESSLDQAEKDKLLKVVHRAVYGAILGAFVQGFGLIAKASQEQKWDISLATCVKIWRSGCIIQSDAIADLLLPLLNRFPASEPLNMLKDIPEVSKEIAETYDALKQVYRIALETNAIAPALGATLEWIKAVGSRQLPTQFQELELDYFGHHNYDIKGEAEPGHAKGKFHTEFATKSGV